MLLNTLGKELESVIAQQISFMSEEHGLLLAQQMGAHSSRSVDTSLDFLVQQIHATQQNNDGVTTMLSLNMMEAFDRVVPARLPYNIRKRRIHELIVIWVGSFNSNRTTTLCLPGYNTDAFPTHTGIHQGSPLLSILFLFSNANHVEICNPLTLSASKTSCIDDVNALAFGKSIEENCRTLQTSYEWCLE